MSTRDGLLLEEATNRQRRLNMATKIKDLDKLVYSELLLTGMLWEIYPDATGNYEEDSASGI